MFSQSGNGKFPEMVKALVNPFAALNKVHFVNYGPKMVVIALMLFSDVTPCPYCFLKSEIISFALCSVE